MSAQSDNVSSRGHDQLFEWNNSRHHFKHHDTHQQTAAHEGDTDHRQTPEHAARKTYKWRSSHVMREHA